ncbi:MAG: MBL fold metallo-hydrolase [Methanobacteriota archaeon]
MTARVRWHGHSCFEVEAERSYLFDPHDGKSIGIPPPSARPDVVFVSHDHFDHNAVRAVETPTTRVVRERGPVEGFPAHGLPAYHDERRGAKRGEVVIYSLSAGGLRFCHLSDLGAPLEPALAAALRPVDVLFVPVGGVFTLDAKAAAAAVAELAPKIAIPMHYRIGGLSIPLHGVDDFVALHDAVLHVGNEVEIGVEDLPGATEVWVFSL